MATNKEFRDSGYAYVILFSCVMLRMMEAYMPLTFGMYLLEFLEYFHTTNTFSVAMLGGLYSFSQAVTGPGAGYVVKRFGARITVIGSSLLSAIALLISGSFPSLHILTVTFITTGLCSQGMVIACQVVVQQYFDKKRSLAAGLNASGACWGILFFPPLARYLIDTYTWRGSYYVYAGIVGNGIVFASLLRPTPTDQQTAKEQAKIIKKESSGNNNRCQLKYLNWFLYLFGIFLLGTGHMTAAVYFPVKAHVDGIDIQKVPFLISVIGILGIFLRPLSGFLGDFKYVDRILLSAVSVSLCGLSLIITTQVSGFPALMALAVMFGIMQAFYAGPTGAQVVDVFTLENVEMGAGLYSLCYGMGLCVLNPVAGLLLDLTGTTDSVFYVFGTAHVCSGIILAVVSRITKHLNKKVQQVPVNTRLALAISLESVNM